MSIENLPFTLCEIHAAYANGLSAKDLVRECFRRIEMANDPAMFIHLDLEKALTAAEGLGAFDPAMPLWGIPFAVKDNIDVAGMPTTAACPDYAYMAEADAYVIAELKKAGAIPIGKTNLDQFATGLVGVRSPYGVPKNSLDPTIVPGGSSSGSAVAVARGIVPFALGTDTAGSGRVPAGLNNIVGLKPSLGALSATGMVPACKTLDTISIFALTVEDAHAVFNVAQSFDARDPHARKFSKSSLSALPPTFTVGEPSAQSIEFFGDQFQQKAFDAALSEIEKLGGQIIEIDFTPFYEIANLLYEGAWVAERYVALEDMMVNAPESLHPTTHKIVSGAEKLTAADAFKGFYRLQELKRIADELVASVDMMAVPTFPTFYTLEDLENDPIGPNSRFGTYTNFVNLMDMCGIAVPTGWREDKRPAHITLLAPAGMDAKIASLASALHQRAQTTLGATDWPLAEADQPKAEIGDDEIGVALVGAHMAGLPLNKDVQGLGGRFVRAGHTAPNYKFYALAGGPPKRPGLIKVKEDGAQIALEVWAMPKENFGAFMQTIPAPLGIGSVELEDGNQVNGFICEAIGAEGAEEITQHGGWRNYLKSLG